MTAKLNRNLSFLLIISLIFILSSCGKGKKFVSIGSGSLSGVYYPMANQISTLVNNMSNSVIRANPEASGGSVYNINAIMNGDLEFGIAQSDRQYQAWNGLAEWEGEPQTNLRAVFSLHPEMITLVATEESGIKSVRDLRDKKVNIGNIGSGQRQNAIEVLSAFGLDYENDMISFGVKGSDAPSHLQDGRIDAFFYTVGHPNGAIKEATTGNYKVRIVPIPNDGNWVNKYPYFATDTILKSFYESLINKGDISTVGVKATLVTRADVPEDYVYEICRAVFENFEQFKTFHNALKTVSKKSMVNDGVTADYHPGALKYFKEIGLK